mmetsp:Transcript_16787/g.46206  ORF Transcript_16787/g.46206 Transcript_16787/m.46206 type:complete len:364 (-) Transcript_16787:194-1285(-)
MAAAPAKAVLLFLAAALVPSRAAVNVLSLLRRAAEPSPDVYLRLLATQRAMSSGSTTAAKDGTAFGPKDCISLGKSNLGTCVITTHCGKEDLSKVEFSFACLNKGGPMPKAVHTYGIGGFNTEEVFDSGVPCDNCTTVNFARRSGGPLAHDEIANVSQRLKGSMDVRHGPHHHDRSAAPKAPAASTPVAFFGPSACVSTYLSPLNTCIIKTRCRGVDLSNFAVGVTCLDQTGDYTRYLFGKNGFDAEEVFDTTLKCKACIGVGDQPSYQLNGLIPKTIVEDLSSLKSELKSLRDEVTILKGSYGIAANRDNGMAASDTNSSSRATADSSSSDLANKAPSGQTQKPALLGDAPKLRDLIRRLVH